MSKRAAMIDKRNQKHRDAAARATDGFVRTPASLADELVEGHRDIGAFTWGAGARVLEPSAGDGALVRAILEGDSDVHVIAVEPNGPRADALDALAAEWPDRLTVHRMMFEDYAAAYAGEPFDAVIMNPPFGDSQRAGVWMDHIRTAWDLMRPGGLLVSIVPNSYPSKAHRPDREFREWATGQGATYEQLPGQPFAESGTGTSAGVLTLPKPMPAHAAGRPAWLLSPAVGAPVYVRGLPVVTSAGALSMPVQEYSDRADGSRPRVLRYAGTCHGCGRCVWVHDDRHDAAVFEACSADAAEYGQAGPSVALCLECGTDGDANAAAARAAQPWWTVDPDADPTADTVPVIYPEDLCAGQWATVRGIDARGWVFTLTGCLMADPERVGGDDGERIAMRLRMASGVEAELYALESARVILRDVPCGTVPKPSGEPRPEWAPQPAAGRMLPRTLADAIENAAGALDLAEQHRRDAERSGDIEAIERETAWRDERRAELAALVTDQPADAGPADPPTPAPPVVSSWSLDMLPGFVVPVA